MFMNIDVIPAKEAFATYFPNYNSFGIYLKSWEDVLAKLEKPEKLDIDIDDFLKLKDSDSKKALKLKFKNGAFDAGPCPMQKDLTSGDYKPSRQKGVPPCATVNMLMLDADNNAENFDKAIADVLHDFEYFAHATISSKKDKPRRRVLIPLAKPCQHDMKEAFIRFLAEKTGFVIDKTCVHAKHLQCLPVFCKNGDEYMFHNKGKFLDESFLPAGWQDVSLWPKWPDEAVVKTKKVSKKAKNIIEETGEWTPVFDKNRLHNAFNNTYRISDILKADGRYKQESTGRWSHTYDNAVNGIQVTNDAILFSHYATDILSVGSILDAYETAMVLKFGSMQKESWQKMQAEVAHDEKVKETMRNMLAVDLPAEADEWALLYDSTEEGIAQRCFAFYPHKVRNGKWWRYQGGIYKPVKDEAMLTDALQMLRIANALQPDDENLQYMLGKASSAKNICTLWKGIASVDEIPDEEWENRPWLLNFTDCTIDLLALCQGREYKLKHDPEHLLTQSTGYAWDDVEHIDPKAMEEVVTNLELYIPDDILRHYLQMALGRALTGIACNEDKCIFLLSASNGRDGGNGKSTLLYGLAGALGNYYLSIESDCLYYNSRDKNPEGPTPVKNQMRQKRFVNFSEYDCQKVLDDAKYKNMTSAGIVHGRGMRDDGGNFKLKCCCFIDTNGQPPIRKKDNAMLRRTRFIPFCAELKADGNVKARWTTDEGIHKALMAWLIIGLVDWYKNGMKIDTDYKDAPEEVYQECKSWFESFDDPCQFFEDYYEITHDPADFLIQEECFKEYCEQIYMRGATLYAFRQAEARWLREHGIIEKQKKPVNSYGLRRKCYVGVRMIGTPKASRQNNLIKVEKFFENKEEKPKQVESVQQNVFSESDVI